jgi:hypothetical protein
MLDIGKVSTAESVPVADTDWDLRRLQSHPNLMPVDGSPHGWLGYWIVGKMFHCRKTWSNRSIWQDDIG